MTQEDYGKTAIITAEDELFIDWEKEESLLDESSYHFDKRVLVLDHGLYVIRER